MPTYTDLGGVRTWYGDHGSGEQVVLLHPGGADSRAFAPNLGAPRPRAHAGRPRPGYCLLSLSRGSLVTVAQDPDDIDVGGACLVDQGADVGDDDVVSVVRLRATNRGHSFLCPAPALHLVLAVRGLRPRRWSNGTPYGWARSGVASRSARWCGR